MLACISPADSQFGETRSTLEFAGRASSIVNKASKNEIETVGALLYIQRISYHTANKHCTDSRLTVQPAL
jgi:hypothetical protein